MNITSIKKFIKDIKKEFKLSTSLVTFCRKLSEEFLTNNLYSWFKNKINKSVEILVLVFWKKLIKKKLNHIINIFLIINIKIKINNTNIFKLVSFRFKLVKYILGILLRKIISKTGIIVANDNYIENR